ncbi:MAG: hypothetical protein VCB78_09940 [Myxococcota bacterium]
MAKLIELDLKPDEGVLRQFGWIALVGFSLVGLLAFKEWLVFGFGLGAARVWVSGGFVGLGVLAALFSLLAPKANLPIYLGLAIVAYPIGFVVSYLILGTIWYVMLAPVGLFFRLTGRDLLNRRFEPGTASYWIDARPARPKEAYFRQY